MWARIKSWFAIWKKRPKIRRDVGGNQKVSPIGVRLADKFTVVVGSWTFILVQTCFLMAWMAANTYLIFFRWDPYPFILLNLFLSFQAAYTGPIIMMAQNRQSQVDRETMLKDYELSEESAEQLEKIARIMELYEQDRKKQFEVLKKIYSEGDNE